MTEDDLWERVARDASAKPYKALALDLAGKAYTRHDKAVERGLATHNRIEKAAQDRPTLRVEIKAAYEEGCVRQAFTRQRDMLLDLAGVIDDRLKRALEAIADHAKAIAAAIRAKPEAGAPAVDDPRNQPPAPAPTLPGPGIS